MCPKLVLINHVKSNTCTVSDNSESFKLLTYVQILEDCASSYSKWCHNKETQANKQPP